MSDALPLATGTWTMDAAHSGVHFKVRHLGISNIRGRFNAASATLVVGADLASSTLSASIDVSSLDTNQAMRDGHVLADQFLAAESHPAMTFASSAIRSIGNQQYEVDGTLTLRGVSRPVTLDVEFAGSEVHPADKKEHAGFTAAARVNRDDFGIDFNAPLGADRWMLGRRVDIDIDAQFVPAG